MQSEKTAFLDGDGMKVFFNAEARRFLRFWSSLQLTFGEFADNHSASRGCDFGGRRGHPDGNFLRALESTKHGACAVRAPPRPHARASIAMPSRPLLFSRASASRRLCVE